ncbi:DUF7380 domain-containing protein [Candidatus Poriferisocius sp.]|uniref:DUF7380 domain-containing protein n=1 Tax=Candidatus Poriferisocius sp. TaxID=3101276 RepID=UPI003B59E10A
MQEIDSRYVEIVKGICIEIQRSDDQRFWLPMVRSHLDRLAKEEPGDLVLRALADACAYHQRQGGDQNQFVVGPFGPRYVLPDGEGVHVYPTPLDNVDRETLECWSDCAAQEALHPLVRSRLADLLWVRRYDAHRRWYQIAINSYVELAETDVEITERGDGLARAIAICKESNHPHLLSEPLEASSSLASHSLEVSDNQYGVVARALINLVDNCYLCADLLDEAIQKYGSDPFRKSQLLEIAARASQEEEEKIRLQRERISVFEGVAGQTSGLLRVSHLEDARTIAHELGLDDEERRLTALIEQTDIDGEMQSFTQEIEISVDEIRPWVDEVVGDDSLIEALLRFGMRIPIDDPENTRAALDEMTRDSLLRSLVTTVHYGPENSMVRIPPDDPLHSDIELGRHNALVIEMFAGTYGKMVLDALHENYVPQAQEIVDFFICEAVPPEIARRIAVSYDRWADSDYTSAVSVIVLTLELIVRRVCRQAGIPVTETRYSDTPVPGVRTLGMTGPRFLVQVL